MVPIPTTEGKATEMVYRYYHWRCSEADILGGEDVDAVVKTGDSPPREFSEFMGVNEASEEEDTPKEAEKYTLDNAPECMGYFDNESDCFEADCDNIREACAKEAGYVKNEDGEFVKVKKKKMKA